MKTLCLILVLALCSTSAFADLHYSPSSLSEDAVGKIKDQASDIVLSMKGVNSIGVTACEENTGVSFYKLSPDKIDSSVYVNCIEIGTETPEAAQALTVLFPPGVKTRFLNVFVNINVNGVLNIQ